MSLFGHRDRAIGLVAGAGAGGREVNWLEKERGDGHREAFGRSGSPSYRLLSHRAKVADEPGAIGYSPHGRCSRRGAKQRTVTPSPPATRQGALEMVPALRW